MDLGGQRGSGGCGAPAGPAPLLLPPLGGALSGRSPRLAPAPRNRPPPACHAGLQRPEDVTVPTPAVPSFIPTTIPKLLTEHLLRVRGTDMNRTDRSTSCSSCSTDVSADKLTPIGVWQLPGGGRVGEGGPGGRSGHSVGGTGLPPFTTGIVGAGGPHQRKRDLSVHPQASPRPPPPLKQLARSPWDICQSPEGTRALVRGKGSGGLSCLKETSGCCPGKRGRLTLAGLAESRAAPAVPPAPHSP